MGWRRVAGRAGVLVGLAALVGLVCALVWANLSVLPAYTVQADGHATIADLALSEAFSANFWFSVIGFFGGLAIGVAVWAQLRTIGWGVAPLTAALAIVSGVVCWMVGQLIGPSPFPARMAAAEPGQTVTIALRLTTPSALAIWVFAAVAVPLFAASLGPELGNAGPEDRRPQRAPADADDEARMEATDTHG